MQGPFKNHDQQSMTQPPRLESKTSNAMLIAGILLIAINLRPALASVGPLIEDIRVSTGLSSSLLGLLTTLPLIGFGVLSTFTPLLTSRFGIGGTMLVAMGLLCVGCGLRTLDSIPALYIGTLLAGISIAIGNVLLPSIAKRNFASESGFITSLYSSAMGLGAALAAGASIPVAHDLGLGWRGALGIWAIPALIAGIVWLPQVRGLKPSESSRSLSKALKDLGTSTLAWQVALFMGLQSLTFYVVLAWLPAILQSRGYDAEYSGWMLSLSQATGILGSLTIPVLAGRRPDQRGIIAGLFCVELVAIFGLLFPALGFVEIWITLIGMVLGGSFGLALLFIVVRSTDTESATELSGMAQSIGYLVAATGPTLFGSLLDLSGNWDWGLYMLLVIAVLKLAMGLGAGRSITLADE